ncbi:hypothetical protein ABK040_012933 [Willaertia magna]
MSSNNYIPLPPSTIVATNQRKQKEIKVKVGFSNASSKVPPPPTTSITVKPPTVAQNNNSSNNDLSQILSKRRVISGEKYDHPYFINDFKIGSGEKKLRIITISDTHNKHKKLEIPEGDILICAGDFTDRGSQYEMEQFNNWLGTLTHKHKIVICGNHEGRASIWEIKKTQEILSNATYLQDTSVCIDGINIYGLPYVPNMSDQPGESYMEFVDNKYFYKSEELLEVIYSNIPENTNILISHTPIRGILDGGARGSTALKERIKHLKELKLLVCGHVHASHGYKQDELNVTHINACNDREQCIYFDYYY